jgi:hypothetical protein
MMQKQEYIGNSQKGRKTTTKPVIIFVEKINAIGDSLSDVASSDDEEDKEDEDDDGEDTQHGKLNKNNKPGWVMGTISKMEPHHMESFPQKQMRLDELTQPGWGDLAGSFLVGNMKYGMTELKGLTVEKTQTDSTAVTPYPTTFGELLHSLDRDPSQSQMEQVKSQQEISQLMLGSEKHQGDNHLVPPLPSAVPNL